MAQAERLVQRSLAPEVVLHLDAQIASARRLLGSVLAQGAAIRARDVEGVLARLTDMKTEMARRAGLEKDRATILLSAARALGIAPEGVTLDAMTGLMAPADAHHVRTLSAELRGLLAEIAREHGVNRALMRQELAFLDHLVRLIGHAPEPGYSPDGASESGAALHHVLDTQA